MDDVVREPGHFDLLMSRIRSRQLRIEVSSQTGSGVRTPEHFALRRQPGEGGAYGAAKGASAKRECCAVRTASIELEVDNFP
jgi:hypothetical protein